MNWATGKKYGASCTVTYINTTAKATTLVIGKFFFARIAGIPLIWV